MMTLETRESVEENRKPKLESNLTQGSKEWLAFRRERVGASDIPIILGISPYKTAYSLWAEKLQLEEPEQAGFAAQRGIAMEPAAREAYTQKTGIEMTPEVVIHPNLPWFVASLDGVNWEKKILLEVKCNGKTNHTLALNGAIPEAHLMQMQHQLIASNLNVGHYWSFDGTEGVLIEVEANLMLQAKVMTAAKLFYEAMVNKEPPELTDKDYVTVNNERLCDLIGAWKDIDAKIKESEKAQETIRDEILKHIKHPRVKSNGIIITSSFRRGNVNYSNIPELALVNLELYRGKGRNVVTFRREK